MLTNTNVHAGIEQLPERIEYGDFHATPERYDTGGFRWRLGYGVNGRSFGWVESCTLPRDVRTILHALARSYEDGAGNARLKVRAALGID